MTITCVVVIVVEILLLLLESSLIEHFLPLMILLNSKKVNAVYDVMVAYCHKVMEKGELDILSGTFPKQMQFLVQCHSISSLPQKQRLFKY